MCCGWYSFIGKSTFIHTTGAIFKAVVVFSGCFGLPFFSKYYLTAHWIAEIFSLIVFVCLFGMTYFWWAMGDDDRAIFRMVSDCLKINFRRREPYR